MGKVIFMDVDGTLLGINGTEIILPDSAVQAIRKTREKGNLVYLCTGRGMAEIDETLLSIGVDGIIGAGGGFILQNDKMLYHKVFKEREIRSLQRYLEENGVFYYLETNTALYCNDDTLNFIKEGPGGEDFLYLFRDVTEADYTNVNKVSFMSQTLKYKDVEKVYGEQYHIVRASWMRDDVEAGEIGLPGVNKGTAIGWLLEHIGADRRDTFGFGDSMNDIEMLEAVNTAVVMGNFRHGMDKYADFVTKDVLDDGVAYAMEHFELI